MADIVERLYAAETERRLAVILDDCRQAAIEIERLRASYDTLVMAVMRGSHREARDVARPRFVEMCPEERGHAEKLARDRAEPYVGAYQPDWDISR